MKNIFLTLFFTTLFVYPLAAQDKLVLSIDDRNSVLTLSEKTGRFSMRVDSKTKAARVPLSIRVIDSNDFVKASVRKQIELKKGKNDVEAVFEERYLGTDIDLWDRVEVTIGNKQTQAFTHFVSVSEVSSTSFELVVVEQLSDVIRGVGLLRVAAVQSATGKPVSNVKVKASFEGDSPFQLSANTNDEGMADIKFEIKNRFTYEDLEYSLEGTRLGAKKTVSGELYLVSGNITILQTDKPIYEPGQEIRARLLLTDESRKPVAGQTIQAVLTEEETGREIEVDEVTTNRFGIASLSFQTKKDTSVGIYKLQIRRSEDDDVFHEINLKISRYELPKFKIEIAPRKEFYLLKDKSAIIDISTNFFFGKPLPNANIEIDCPKCDFDFETISGTTDEKGSLSVTVPLTSEIADEFRVDDRFVDLGLRVSATDADTNRTESKIQTLRISKKALHVYLVRKTETHSNRVPTEFYVTTFYPNGEPAKAKIRVYEREEDTVIEPDYEYRSGRKVAETSTNKYGVSKVMIQGDTRKEGGGSEGFVISAIDKNGLIGTATPGSDYYDDVPGFELKLHKRVLAQGEPIEFWLGGSDPMSTVFVDVLSKGRTIYSTRTSLDNKQRLLRIPFRKEFKGILHVRAYSLVDEEDSDTVEISEGLIYPYQSNLEIKDRDLRKEYLPGQEVSLRLRAQLERNGFGAESQMGVLIVDEAIEARAQSIMDSDPDQEFLSFFGTNLSKFLGVRTVLGNISRNKLNKLDPPKKGPGRSLTCTRGRTSGRTSPDQYERQ